MTGHNFNEPNFSFWSTKVFSLMTLLFNDELYDEAKDFYTTPGYEMDLHTLLL
jgi:hypothetical protein